MQNPPTNKRTYFFFPLVRGAEKEDIIFLGQVPAIQVFYLPLFFRKDRNVDGGFFPWLLLYIAL